MTRLQWGLIGGGRGSQIGPAHRIGAGLDGLFGLAAGALDHRPDEGIAYATTRRDAGVAYAVRASELEALLATGDLASPVAVPDC